jgi:hypothetical protein
MLKAFKTCWANLWDPLSSFREYHHTRLLLTSSLHAYEQAILLTHLLCMPMSRLCLSYVFDFVLGQQDLTSVEQGYQDFTPFGQWFCEP